jgi:hypothetical protein
MEPGKKGAIAIHRRSTQFAHSNTTTVRLRRTVRESSKNAPKVHARHVSEAFVCETDHLSRADRQFYGRFPVSQLISKTTCCYLHSILSIEMIEVRSSAMCAFLLLNYCSSYHTDGARVIAER